MKRSIVVGGAAFSIAFSVAVGVAACGGVTSGGAPGSGSVSGTVGGISFNVADAVVVAENGTLAVDARTVLIYLFDIPSVCALAQSLPAHSDKGNYTAIELQLSSFATSTQTSAGPVVAGTYTIGAQSGGPTDAGTSVRASASLQKKNAQCDNVVPSGDHSAMGGTITITSITGSGVIGSYSATFVDGTMSGSFNAAFCSLPDRTKQPPSDAGTTCVP